MLQSISFIEGPKKEVKFSKKFSDDLLNYVFGTNLVGKSTLLNFLWFGLTGCYPKEVNPRVSSGGRLFSSSPKAKDFSSVSLTWIGDSNGAKSSKMQIRCEGPAVLNHNALVVYMMANGEFAIYDPIKNPKISSKAFVFTPKELLYGQEKTTIGDQKTFFCNGMVIDLANWQREKGKEWNLFLKLFGALTKFDLPDFCLGNLVRIAIDDSLDYPTFISDKLPGPIPLPCLPSFLKRWIGLVYCITWAKIENEIAAKLLGVGESRELVLLIDDLEANLDELNTINCREVLRFLSCCFPSNVMNIQTFFTTMRLRLKDLYIDQHRISLNEEEAKFDENGEELRPEKLEKKDNQMVSKENIEDLKEILLTDMEERL